MKYNSYNNVKCPFYKCEQKQQLHCEGISSDTRTHLWFVSNDALKKHKEKYCKQTKGCTQCPLYSAIEVHYEEDQDGE